MFKKTGIIAAKAALGLLGVAIMLALNPPGIFFVMMVISAWND